MEKLTIKGLRHYLGFLMGLLLAFTLALPIIALLVNSLSVGWRWPDLFPQALTNRAWSYVLSSTSGTYASIGLSLEIALVVTIINLILGMPGAYALARYSFRGKMLVEGIVYAPIIVPAFVSTMGIQLTFLRLGLTESVLGVILAHLAPTLPYMVRALIISFQTLEPSLEDQARTLGAGWWQCFWQISLPHLVPGMVAGASLSILISLSQYLITFLIGGGQVVTLPLLMFPFINGGDLAIGSAYAILFSGMAGLALYVMSWVLKHYYGKRLDFHI
ncbi:ABC transporter permease [Desulfosporosinus meridiei]|uniref:ABC-type spermidine/putrescine transport system, permease component II n=1 Tax=Desulfosporosinus meridiei (strain ATCC BAA-275 / DSM 13257 / KCTC 12902 / NCIMB 13706 / S10) TaxID=768704 RepID=J7IWD0_DESMD|nr:ABC transporter permease [Desulfosporosinus meridiei]AFQ43413.1 ABC-type spermidine/putrescine transport system, permease component II [Desulfosporosinus meridiei DSM 13257]